MEEEKTVSTKTVEKTDGSKKLNIDPKQTASQDGGKADEESKHNHSPNLHVSTQRDKNHLSDSRDDFDHEDMNKSWQEYRVTGKAPRRRGYHASFIYDNFLYIHGGQDIREGTLDKMYKINLEPKSSENNWEEVIWKGVEKPGKISYHKLIRYEKKVYLIGGSNLEIDNEKMFEFDISTSEWKSVKPHGGIKPDWRDEHSAVLWNDIIVLFSGNVKGFKSNDVWFYYIKENKWEEIKTSDPPAERSNHCATIYGDSMFIFGGKDSENNKLNDLWQLNLTTKAWKKIEQKGDIPIERSGWTIITYKDYLVMFGGIFELTKELGDWYVFDIKSSNWYTLFDDFDSPTNRGSPSGLKQMGKLGRTDSIKSPSPMHKNSNSFQADNSHDFSMNLKKTKASQHKHTSIFEVDSSMMK